jgi:hypothetical protein
MPLVVCVLAAAWTPPAPGAALIGYLRDQNWYAWYTNKAPGVGYYEYAINGNAASNSAALGVVAATGIFGEFTNYVAAGSYTIASWDVWWRSAYAFNVAVGPSGYTPRLDLRLHAAMWGYPAFWDDTGYAEFGQTFAATGPISMIYLRVPGSSGNYRLTIHENAPGGAQVGQERTFGVGDQRPIYGYGQMPTVSGRTYYARIRSTTPGVIMQMDPRPDFSDPMPGGCLWVGAQGNVRPLPDRDLGLVIMCDDDGLLTDLFTRSGGSTLNGKSIGQTFIARGVGLISAAVWLADPATPLYVVRVLKDGPDGEQVGTSKRGKPARVTADPEMLVTWSPGECPLVPGNTYYVEITRADQGTVNAGMANPGNPFAHGQAYVNKVALPSTDLAGTLMEEETPGSAARPRVLITREPEIRESERLTDLLTVRWQTDVASDSKVEFAVDAPPYIRTIYDEAAVTNHAVTLTGLKPHAMYHWRVSSSAAGHRVAISRDIVTCTKPVAANLLTNPGFEEGITTSAASRPLVGWSKTPGVDIQGARSGRWFWGLTNRSGSWLLQGAVNGNSSEASVYQSASVTPGKTYTFSAWLTTWMRENGTFKFDVWYDRGRLTYMRLGIDPTGGTNPQGTTVEWTPRFYSHLRFSNVAKTAVAQSSSVTVFIHMKGSGGEWHLYGVDDCVLTETSPVQPYLADPEVRPDGKFAARILGDAGTTNSIEFSSDLANWTPWGTVRQTNVSTLFVDDPEPGPTNRFYRIRN